MRTLTRIGLGVGAAVIAVGLTAGVYVSAQDANGPRAPFMGRRGGPGGPGGPGGLMALLGPMFSERLNLTDAQKDQLKTIAESHREEFRALGDRAIEARRALRAAATADTLDEGLIRARAAELGNIEADLTIAGARLRAEAFRVLTAEQQTQAKEMESRLPQRMGQRRERGEQRRPQPGR